MDPFCYFCFVPYTVLSVPCSLVVTCWERADLLVFLNVMFSCIFVTFPCGVLGQVWYLIVWIPDLCLLPFFVAHSIRVIPSLLCSNCECSLYFGRICFHDHLRFSNISETYDDVARLARIRTSAKVSLVFTFIYQR